MTDERIHFSRVLRSLPNDDNIVWYETERQLVELAVLNTDGFSSSDSALHTELQGGEDPSTIDPSMNNYSSLASMRDIRAITEVREVFTKICSQRDELQECVKFLQERSTEMEYDLSIIRKQAQEADISHQLAENISTQACLHHFRGTDRLMFITTGMQPQDNGDQSNSEHWESSTSDMDSGDDSENDSVIPADDLDA
ncbi:hypothetical protein BU17DRAFT_66519 [Hysterangium stoloniferum]|nr:hypothetical protein BU17DRAFT_66519 [Hysterangium stoloniferum]